MRNSSKKYIIFFLLSLPFIVSAQIYIGQKCSISFFSKTPMEDIDAINTNSKPVFNSKNGMFVIKAAQKDFNFKSGLMQTHYNENYVESEKYPSVTFSGKLNEVLDYTKNGKYNVTLSGNLDLHGVSLFRTIIGKIEVRDEKIIMESKFDIKVEDHKILIPKLLFKKIAEIIHVSFSAELVLKKN